MNEDHIKRAAALIQYVPDTPSRHRVIEILDAITKGAAWSDDDFREMFYGLVNGDFAPSGRGSKRLLPRAIQEAVGKIARSKALPAGKIGGNRGRTIYKEPEEDTPEEDLVDVFLISCACGATFFGKEPEHQVFCEKCKLQNKVKPTEEQHKDVDDQLRLMINILKRKRWKPYFQEKVLNNIRGLMKDKGLSDEDIDDAILEVMDEETTPDSDLEEQVAQGADG